MLLNKICFSTFHHKRVVELNQRNSSCKIILNIVEIKESRSFVLIRKISWKQNFSVI